MSKSQKTKEMFQKNVPRYDGMKKSEKRCEVGNTRTGMRDRKSGTNLKENSLRQLSVDPYKKVNVSRKD